MVIPVLILGESGAGKTTSLRYFENGECFVFNVAGKPLPFRKTLDKVNNPDYQRIRQELSRQQYKTYIIDDSQYLLAFEMFDRAKDTGYGKFTDMAIHFKSLIDYVIRNTAEDVIVYFLHHTETLEGGKVKAKTVGKMLDNQLTLEGLFSIVLLATVEGNQHIFVTQSDGSSTAKSPMDMFQYRIDNDLKFVDTVIRQYWNIQTVDPGEQTINRNDWDRLCKVGGNVQDVIQQAYTSYDYNRPTEIKKKDFDKILETAAVLFLEYRRANEQKEGAEHGEGFNDSAGSR